MARPASRARRDRAAVAAGRRGGQARARAPCLDGRRDGAARAPQRHRFGRGHASAPDPCHAGGLRGARHQSADEPAAPRPHPPRAAVVGHRTPRCRCARLRPRAPHARGEGQELPCDPVRHAGRANARSGDARSCQCRPLEPCPLRRSDQRRPAAHLRHRRQGAHRRRLRRRPHHRRSQGRARDRERMDRQQMRLDPLRRTARAGLAGGHGRARTARHVGGRAWGGRRQAGSLRARLRRRRTQPTEGNSAKPRSARCRAGSSYICRFSSSRPRATGARCGKARPPARG